MKAQAAVALESIRHQEALDHDNDHPTYNSDKNHLSPEEKQKRKKKKSTATHNTDLLPRQLMVYEFYVSNTIQFIVAGLIFLNFFVASINAQIRPKKNTGTSDIFYGFEIAFAILFSIELAINMYGSWFWHFWKSGWNWFDFIIVWISLLAIGIENLPGISVLRLFRAFRVFRLFKRIPSLKHIIEGVFASLPGVANAFVVLTILMGIWSIMGVQFYSHVSEQEFGTFMKSMFTMWQIMTMDSWSSGIARKIIYQDEMPWASIYFISYLFVAGIVMTNVIVAILLENYLNATNVNTFDDEDDEDEDEEDEEEYDAITEMNEANPNSMMGERLEGITKAKLIELVGEVLTTQRVERLERKEINELYYALYSHEGGRKQLTTQLAAYKAEFDKEKKLKEKTPSNNEGRNGDAASR